MKISVKVSESPEVKNALANQPEWDMRGIPASESPSAWDWEIAREKAWQENGRSFPENPQKVVMSDDEYRQYLKRKKWTQDQTPPYWHHNPDWPKRSYREAKHRKPDPEQPVLWALIEADLFKTAQGFCDSGPPWPLSYFDRKPGESFQIAPLEIDWRNSDRVLLERFTVWLKRSRPAGEFPSREIKGKPPWLIKPRGEGSYTRQAEAKLKRLTVWRLVDHYGLKQAAVEALNSEMGLGLYAGKSKYSQALSAIRKELAKLPAN